MNAMPYPMIAERLFNRPLAVLPDKAEIILQALAPQFNLARLRRPDGVTIELPAGALGEALQGDALTSSLSPAAFDTAKKPEDRHPFEVAEGVAFIPVHGTLVQRSGWLDAASGLLSYQTLGEWFHAAMDDDDIQAVFLDIDSPGGEVAGLFDLVDEMSLRVGKKPIHAHACELAASAAYAVATVADHLSTPRTGYVGSVGVIAFHFEFSRYLEAEGITVTVLRAGKKKATVNDLEPLSDEDRDLVQSDLNHARGIFVDTVARNRGLSADAVAATEALLLGAPAALDALFIDAVMSREEAMFHLFNQIA